MMDALVADPLPVGMLDREPSWVSCGLCGTYTPFRTRQAIGVHLTKTHRIPRDDRERREAAILSNGGPPPAMVHFSFTLPDAVVKEIDGIVRTSGEYATRVDLIREALARLIAGEYESTMQARYLLEKRRRETAEERLRKMRSGIDEQIKRMEVIRRA